MFRVLLPKSRLCCYECYEKYEECEGFEAWARFIFHHQIIVYVGVSGVRGMRAVRGTGP